MVKIVKELIHEFDSIDPKSMNFRYPVNKNLQPIHSTQNYDIDNFKEVMDKISNYFDNERESIRLLEDYNAEMDAEVAKQYASCFYHSIY